MELRMTKVADNLPNRRSMLAAAVVTGAAVVSAGRAQADIHPTPGVEFALELLVELAPPQEVGATPYGVRTRIPIVGGTFVGPRIKGKVVSGGADWQLHRADGSTVIEADYMIQADDGTLININNRGIVSGKPGSPDMYLRTTPVFEAPIGPHDWMNKAVFVGTVEGVPNRASPTVCVRVFKVT